MLNELYPQLDLSRASSDWGGIDAGNLPSGSFTSKSISGLGIWATTGQFSNIAKDHCGAVAVTNLALIFSRWGHNNLLFNNNINSIFREVHAIVGDGPKMMFAGDAVTYFDNGGVTLNHSSVPSINSYRRSIDNNRPVGILLANGITQWNWILVMGYRNYTSSNTTYFQIVDGWNNSSNRFYRPQSGSTWVSATEYRVN